MADFREWFLLDEVGIVIKRAIFAEALLMHKMRMILEAIHAPLNEEEEKDPHHEAKMRLKKSVETMRLQAIAERGLKIQILKMLNEEYKTARGSDQLKIVKEATPLLESLGYIHMDDLDNFYDEVDQNSVIAKQIELASRETGNDLPEGLKAEEFVSYRVEQGPNGRRVFRFFPTDTAKKAVAEYFEILMNTRNDPEIPSDFVINLDKKAERQKGRIARKKGGVVTGHRAFEMEDLAHKILTKLIRPDASKEAHGMPWGITMRRQKMTKGVGQGPEHWSWPEKLSQEATPQDVYKYFLGRTMGADKREFESATRSMSPSGIIRPENNDRMIRTLEKDLRENNLGFYVRYLEALRKGTERAIVAKSKEDQKRLAVMKDIEFKAQTPKGKITLGNWRDPENIALTLLMYKREYPAQRTRSVAHLSQQTRSRDSDAQELDVSPHARDDDATSGPDWSGERSRMPQQTLGLASRMIENSFKEALNEMARDPNFANEAFVLSVKFELGWRFTPLFNDLKQNPEFPEKIKRSGWFEVTNSGAILSQTFQTTADGMERGGSRNWARGRFVKTPPKPCEERLRYWGLSLEETTAETNRLLGTKIDKEKIRRWMNKGLEGLCIKLKEKLNWFA